MLSRDVVSLRRYYPEASPEILWTIYLRCYSMPLYPRRATTCRRTTLSSNRRRTYACPTREGVGSNIYNHPRIYFKYPARPRRDYDDTGTILLYRRVYC